jgi:hypothetical protein
VAYDEDRLRVPSRHQELGDHVSSGRQAISYNKSDQQSDTAIDQDSIGDYPIF